MGKLPNFNWLIYPQFLRPWVCDISVTFLFYWKQFILLLSPLHILSCFYLSTGSCLNLLVKQLVNAKIICLSTTNNLFNKYGRKFHILYSFLSYVVSFPNSEAVVQSWGSSIDLLNKNKPHAMEVIGLDDTGTIDKLAFVRHIGPPPGFQQNKVTYFTKDFLHVGGRNLKTTSLVIERIMNSNDNIALLYGLINLC